jgi:hypothetical protein
MKADGKNLEQQGGLILNSCNRRGVQLSIIYKHSNLTIELGDYYLMKWVDWEVFYKK